MGLPPGYRCHISGQVLLMRIQTPFKLISKVSGRYCSYKLSSWKIGIAVINLHQCSLFDRANSAHLVERITALINLRLCNYIPKSLYHPNPTSDELITSSADTVSLLIINIVTNDRSSDDCIAL